MNDNETLQKNVQNAIKWEPLLHAAEIGVIAKDGVITLTGYVDSFAKKLQAEDAAKNVAGVMAVVEKIEIKMAHNLVKKDDTEIATEVLNALSWNWLVPHDKVKVKVEKGWVTLEGELQWNYQREAAYNAVKNLIGILGVMNELRIKSELNDAIEKTDIIKALGRTWSINDRQINVDVKDHKVTLTGIVGSWYQKDEAARIAWKAPGVWEVDNQLAIEYDYTLVD